MSVIFRSADAGALRALRKSPASLLAVDKPHACLARVAGTVLRATRVQDNIKSSAHFSL